MAASVESDDAALSDADDSLRALMSAMLSGNYAENLYLWDVASLCRANPESAPKLLGLVDRYHRLGRMPRAQQQKVKAKINQVLASLQQAEAEAGHPPKPIPTPAANQTPLGGQEPVTAQKAAANRPASDEIAANEITRDLQPAKTMLAEPAVAMPQPTPAPSVEPPQVLVAIPPTPVQTAPETQTQPATPPLAASPNDIGVGSLLRDRYELQMLLGRGGMGAVYSTLDRYRVSLNLDGHHVALKMVSSLHSQPDGTTALSREFHNTQRLSHPNVVNVYDIDHEGAASFYTMELIEGEQLHQLLQHVAAALPRKQALSIIRDIGAAISHAHSRGVVHADLKPQNVMITSGGEIRVLDFSGGKIIAREPWISELSTDNGHDLRRATPAYASCEQLEGWPADPRDDIYALSCIAYLLLTGKHPFDRLPALEARARGLRPKRPQGLSSDSWRALRHGLAWSRQQRSFAVDDWLKQLNLDAAAKTLPPLAQLHAIRRPARLWPQRVAAAALLIIGIGVGAQVLRQHIGTGIGWPQLTNDTREALSGMQRAVATATHAVVSMLPSTPIVTPPTTAAAATDSNSSPAIGSTANSNAHAHELTAAPGTDSGIPSKPTANTVSADHHVTGAQAVATNTRAQIGFSAPSYTVSDGQPAARIIVQRHGSTRDDVRFVWWTEEASAKPDVDYASLGTRIEHIPSGADKTTLFVPIISNPTGSASTQFDVVVSQSGNADTTPTVERTTVTIERGG